MAQALPAELLYKIIEEIIDKFSVEIIKIKNEDRNSDDEIKVTGIPVVQNLMLVNKSFYGDTLQLLSKSYDGKVATKGLSISM